MIAFTKAQGSYDISILNELSTPDLPKTILVAMVSNVAYNGQTTLNPFNFKHYNLTWADVQVNSKSILGKPLEFNMATKEYLEAYWNLHTALGYTFKDDSCSITRNEYDNGFTVLCFDLTPTLCNGTYTDPVETGSVNIKLKFAVALNH